MLEILEAAERELPKLLQSPEGWWSLNIDYHPPFVERLFCQWGDYRINLHRIFPCEPEEALFHPHPWPSAMHILSGTYEMAVGYGKGQEAPPIAAKMIASGDLRYEMTDPNAWHYVRPIGGPALTVMLTGKPWHRPFPGPERPLLPLEDDITSELFDLFRTHF